MFKIANALLLVFLVQSCTQKPAKQSVNKDGITPIPLSTLPKSLDESSGLEVVGDKIYSINDHGGKPELFVLDKQGHIHNKIKIQQFKNHDWESLAANKTHFFIGDFGNNAGDREDLTILYFPIGDLKKDKITPRKIQFKYAKQTRYSNQTRRHSFDGEALIAIEDTLVIFSKDWVKYNTQVYHVPLGEKDKPVLLSPKEQMSVHALITGADYDAANQRLVLCGYRDDHNYIWVFQNSSTEKFLTDDFRQYELNGLYKAQVEGVSFLTDHQILISTEQTKAFKQQMWVVDLNK